MSNQQFSYNEDSARCRKKAEATFKRREEEYASMKLAKQYVRDNAARKQQEKDKDKDKEKVDDQNDSFEEFIIWKKQQTQVRQQKFDL